MSEKTLNISLRPRTLSELYGQEATVNAIRKHIAKRPPHAWMLTGSSGTGKTTLARLIALGFQCSHAKLWGDACQACRNSYAQFAIHEINASDVNGVDEIRQVVEMAKTKPVNSPYRVFILDEFHRATSAAQNLLLKPTEEPPPYTIWIIATTDPTKVLPTLRRRFTTYNLRPLGDAAEQFLIKSAKQAGIERPLKPLIEQLDTFGISSPGVILMALEKYAAGASAVESVSGIDGGTIDTLRICRAVIAGDWGTLQKALKESNPDQCRYIRASVSGYIKGCLMRESGARAERFARCLIDINAIAPLDDANLHPWLIGILFVLCRRFEQR